MTASAAAPARHSWVGGGLAYAANGINRVELALRERANAFS
jgi:hypothetical protein